MYKQWYSVVCEQISLIFEPQITTKTAYQNNLYSKKFRLVCQLWFYRAYPCNLIIKY